MTTGRIRKKEHDVNLELQSIQVSNQSVFTAWLAAGAGRGKDDAGGVSIRSVFILHMQRVYQNKGEQAERRSRVETQADGRAELESQKASRVQGRIQNVGVPTNAVDRKSWLK